MEAEDETGPPTCLQYSGNFCKQEVDPPPEMTMAVARDPISGFALISPARDQGPGSREFETYLAEWTVVLA